METESPSFVAPDSQGAWPPGASESGEGTGSGPGSHASSTWAGSVSDGGAGEGTTSGYPSLPSPSTEDDGDVGSETVAPATAEEAKNDYIEERLIFLYQATFYRGRTQITKKSVRGNFLAAPFSSHSWRW